MLCKCALQKRCRRCTNHSSLCEMSSRVAANRLHLVQTGLWTLTSSVLLLLSWLQSKAQSVLGVPPAVVLSYPPAHLVTHGVLVDVSRKGCLVLNDHQQGYFAPPGTKLLHGCPIVISVPSEFSSQRLTLRKSSHFGCPVLQQ